MYCLKRTTFNEEVFLLTDYLRTVFDIEWITYNVFASIRRHRKHRDDLCTNPKFYRVYHCILVRQ